MGETRSVYFPNLNGLRFLAALAVIVHHSEQLKAMFGMPSVWGRSPMVFILGELGVVLFFVLSGFLITSLLLEEERRAVIQVGRFYLRRALRIWPLYYLIVGLSVFVLPHLLYFTWPGYGIGADGVVAAYLLGWVLLPVANLAANPRIGWSLEQAPLHYLGKISYGLYMFHPLAIVTAIRVLTSMGIGSDLAFYPLCLLIVIALASVSYRFLESPFLRQKDRFASIVSGDRARDPLVHTY